MDSDPFKTQRDVSPALVSELSAAGFADADEIGRGGFGIVYRCTQVALDRIVAVKVLTAELAEDRERFLREQRAMGRLTGHPNIVGLLQVGVTTSDHPYLVMPYHQRGSLEARIKELGILPLDEVLRFGVKMAGALESAHRLAILHRDVKPANVLLTDYGEPALSDFGIAHISGAFKTATGTFTGSPAFTAPEILSGEPPSRASDLYSLGATLFCALTGHAAFERRSGEQVVAQFLRIATESAPDPRESGIPDDVAAVVESAMARDPKDRPSAQELGERIQHLQARHNLAIDEMALHAETGTDLPAPHRSTVSGTDHRRRGNVPLELTSFVGRGAELSEVKKLLAASRLVTLTGVGGVGKTRLALRAAAAARHDFPDGVWLVELGELLDGSLLPDVVSSTLGLRDDSGRPSGDILVDFLCARTMLLVLDNCEQVVDAAAKLAETLLRVCPDVRILATSREALGIGGETVLPLPPLDVADATALFAERAAAGLPGFKLTDQNADTVSRICARLDGLPLSIELAAARVKAMSPEQILSQLVDRYTLLTHGARGAPTRQQKLAWSIGWSYDLCTPTEQRLWSRLSVFAGNFELEAAEHICGENLTHEDVIELIFSLVDKSILIRTESDSAVRFRLLETLRDYGRARVQHDDEYADLRHRHLHWYRQLSSSVLAEWFSDRQVYWIKRAELEMANLREALEFGLADRAEAALGIAASLVPFSLARGTLGEWRRWLDRALASTAPAPTIDRMWALYGAVLMAGLQNDLPVETSLVSDARALVEEMSDPVAHALFSILDGFAGLVSGDLDRAYERFEDAVGASDDPIVHVQAMILLGWTLEFGGDIGRALVWQEKALAIAESAGEAVYRSGVLWSLGIGWWRHGKSERAKQLLRDSLRLARLVNHPRNIAACFEALSWIVRAENPRRATVLMAAAQELGRWVGVSPAMLPDLAVFHDECERRARDMLGDGDFEAARRDGQAMSVTEALDYALED